MRAIATSELHPNLCVEFKALKIGRNYRRLRGSRHNYCLDYSSSNSHVCGCGYPVTRTKWEIFDEKAEVVIVEKCEEWTHSYKHNYIMIEIVEKR